MLACHATQKYKLNTNPSMFLLKMPGPILKYKELAYSQFGTDEFVLLQATRNTKMSHLFGLNLMFRLLPIWIKQYETSRLLIGDDLDIL